MKKILLSALMVCAVTLTACSSTSSSRQVGPTQTENGMSTVSQLVLGSLKLEDTNYIITSEQASELLPMWQVYEELLSSDTAAQAEIDALISQIQETMSQEQLQAISDMQLTQQDMVTVMQGASTFTSKSQSNNSVTVPSGGGGISAGGPPDGSGAPPEMGGGLPSDPGGAAPDMSSGGIQNAQTDSSQARAASGVPTALIQMLIELLQQKIAA